MNVRRRKINSISGKNRRHSVLRDLVPFLRGLKDLHISRIASGPMRYSKVKPVEPIEIRAFDLDQFYVGIRAYDDQAFQRFKVFCHKSHYRKDFAEVLSYIDNYCLERLA